MSWRKALDARGPSTVGLTLALLAADLVRMLLSDGGGDFAWWRPFPFPMIAFGWWIAWPVFAVVFAGIAAARGQRVLTGAATVLLLATAWSIHVCWTWTYWANGVEIWGLVTMVLAVGLSSSVLAASTGSLVHWKARDEESSLVLAAWLSAWWLSAWAFPLHTYFP